jgi:hypothetical protein
MRAVTPEESRELAILIRDLPPVQKADFYYFTIVEKQDPYEFLASIPVQKHLPGGHDQKDHGSWATGGGIGHLSESTAQEIEESTRLFQELLGADNDLKETLTGYGYQSDLDYEKLENRLTNRYQQAGLGKNTAILQARIDIGRVQYAMRNATLKAEYEETIQKNRERAILNEDEYTESYIQVADEMEKGLAYAEAQVTNAMKNGDVTVAMSQYVLSSVLVEGRYKNQFETRTSGGKLDVGIRKVGEGLATGTPAGTKLADRPIYGYLTDNETVHTYESKRDAVNALEGEWSDKHSLDRTLDWQTTTSVNSYQVDQYGDIRVVLKPSVRERTTVTIGDSLRTGVMADGMTNPKPNLVNMGLYKAGAAAHMSGNSTAGYLEAQIHGGVKVSDISRIYAPRDRVASIEGTLARNNLDIPVIAREGS